MLADLTFFISLPCVAVFAGLVIGFLGLGAGLVLVPTLSLVLLHLGGTPSADMHVAIGTTLSLISVSSFMALRAHVRMSSTFVWDAIKRWLPKVLFGIALGGLLSRVSNSLVLNYAFLALIVVTFLLSRVSDEAFKTLIQKKAMREHMYWLGLPAAALATLLGVGGSVFAVPIFRAMHFPLKKAIPIGLSTAFCVGFFGMITSIINGWGLPDRPPYSVGYLNVPAFLLIAPIMMTLSPVGARLSQGMPKDTLRMVYSAFLCLMMLVMLFKLLG
jgi:uncharacterized protein